MTQSAGVVVVDWRKPEPLILCVRAYSNWDFPKGVVEKGESLVQAAIRELMEALRHFSSFNHLRLWK